MSTDILTQLQTCYDQLLIQIFSSVSYNARRHPLIAPEEVAGDPYTKPSQDVTIRSGRHQYVSYKLGPEDTKETTDLRPQDPDSFDQAQLDLADDLIVKAQQIDYLIKRLPGLGKGEKEQNAEIERLVEQVKIMENRRKEKRKDMRKCLEQLDHVVLGMAKSIDNTTAGAAKTTGAQAD